MIEFVENALKSPAGSFAFVFALLCLAFWVTHHVTKWSTKLKHVDKIESSLDTIKDDLSSIKAFITIFRESNNPFARAQSPVKLTDKGQEVAKDLEVSKLITRHWDKINEDLCKALKNDANPYDIQQEAIKIASKIQKYLTPDELDKVKRYAFDHGHALSLYDLLIGIHIRDAYFKKHSINVDDVDKHDPNRSISS